MTPPRETKRTDAVVSEELLQAFHMIYGLRLAASVGVPGLPLQTNAEPPEVRVRLRDGWPFPAGLPVSCEGFYSRGSNEAPGDEPSLRAGKFPSGKHFGFFYADGPRFAASHDGSEVWADWPEDYTLEDACTYLVGPVLGFVLRLRGRVCLHASSVGIEDCAIALMGAPGAGKSTTAAAFSRLGFTALSDDIVALADKGTEFLVQPGYPRVNLWPDSVQQLFGSEDALPRITPTWDKRYLPLGQNGHRFASSAMPLRAIYILDGRDEALAVPVIEAVSREQAFMTLVANTYVNYLLTPDMRRTEFDVLGRVVSEIPIRRVRPPAEPSAIFQLCEAIAADARLVIPRGQAHAVPMLG